MKQKIKEIISHFALSHTTELFEKLAHSFSILNISVRHKAQNLIYSLFTSIKIKIADKINQIYVMKFHE